MIKLLLSDLRTHIGSQIATLVVIIAATITCGFGVAFIETGVRAAGDLTGGSLILSGALISAVIVVAVVMTLTAELRRQEYARWQLAGVTPSSIRLIVLGQAFALGLIGSTIGCIIAIPVVPNTVDALFKTPLGLGPTRYALGPLGMVVLIALIVGLAVLSSTRSGRSASRTPPIAVLRESTPPMPQVTLKRWLLIVGVALSVGVIMVRMLTGNHVDIFYLGTFLGPSLVALVGICGPLVFANVLRAWTRLIPAHRSKMWFLARHNARHKTAQSGAGILTLILLITIPGTIPVMSEIVYRTQRQIGDAYADQYLLDAPGNLPGLMLYLGAPFLLAITGAAMVVLLSGKNRERENATLRAAGADAKTIVGASVLEAFIQATTALILSIAVMSAVSFVAAVSLSNTINALVPPVMPLAVPLVTFAFGLVLTTVSTVIPTMISLRKTVPRALVAF